MSKTMLLIRGMHEKNFVLVRFPYFLLSQMYVTVSKVALM